MLMPRLRRAEYGQLCLTESGLRSGRNEERPLRDRKLLRAPVKQLHPEAYWEKGLE